MFFSKIAKEVRQSVKAVVNYAHYESNIAGHYRCGGGKFFILVVILIWSIDATIVRYAGGIMARANDAAKSAIANQCLKTMATYF